MKRVAQLALIFGFSLMLSACLYGQCFDGPCAFERQRIIDAIKGYGEYWVKPGMSKESWRQDWVACGGQPNGAYANDAPQFSSMEIITAAGDRIRKTLGDCMTSKGYHLDYNAR